MKLVFDQHEIGAMIAEEASKRLEIRGPWNLLWTVNAKRDPITIRAEIEFAPPSLQSEPPTN